MGVCPLLQATIDDDDDDDGYEGHQQSGACARVYLCIIYSTIVSLKRRVRAPIPRCVFGYVWVGVHLVVSADGSRKCGRRCGRFAMM